MVTINIFLKGWADKKLFADAVNDPTHARHADAMPVYYRSFKAYEPGDDLYLAATYDAADGIDDLTHCDQAFERFNVGEDAIARLYRSHGHRSLSVGDVVVIDDRAYTCGSVRWLAVELPEA